MRNLISLAHISLDGFMAGPGGDMSFVSMSPEMADHIYPLIHGVDLAVYGRVTHEMMAGYWPGVVDDPAATENERSHARWYAGVDKIVASRTLASRGKVRVVGDDIVGALRAAKQQPGGDIMVFASPTLMHALVAADVVDTYQLTIQPAIVGGGLALFPALPARQKLQLAESRTFANGVIAARYTVKR